MDVNVPATSRPAVDPELEPILQRVLGMMPKPVTREMIPLIRQARAAGRLDDSAMACNGAFTVERHRAPGLAGGPDVPLVLCRPTGATGPRPVLYFIHGGGMVSGDAQSPELIAELARAESVQAVVVSVDYRLAPEYPYPAAVEDCYAGLVWLAEHADELELRREQIVISGASSGAGLAAATTLRTRDSGGPRLLGQMLQSPMLDDRCDSASAVDLDGYGTWDRTASITGWTALLGDRRGTDQVTYDEAPGRADDLGSLPATLIDVGSVDTFRDEAIEFANKVWMAGGAAELHVWPGGFHGFDLMAPNSALAQSANSARLAWLGRLFTVWPAPADHRLL